MSRRQSDLAQSRLTTLLALLAFAASCLAVHASYKANEVSQHAIRGLTLFVEAIEKQSECRAQSHAYKMGL